MERRALQTSVWAAICTLTAAWSASSSAQTVERVASGLSSPIFATAPASDPNHLYIVEQGSGGTARIKTLDLQTNKVGTTPFLTISGLQTGGEQGLLGLAFHPDFATNGKFYVDLSVPGGSFGSGITQIREYTVSAANPAVADPSSAKTLLSITKPQTNHNGGWIGFSPRANDGGNLYIATGDGGNGNDTGPGHNAAIGNAQDRNSLLGKMLRINVDRDDFANDATRNYGIPTGNRFAAGGGSPEIFNVGLRNPFRDSFDRATGDLLIGDVGQSAREEIDFQPASNPNGGENYGWRVREGTIAGPGANDNPQPTDTLVNPIHDYGRNLGGATIGGYVYRGDQFPVLQGTYFYGDEVSNRIFSFRYENGVKTDLREWTSQFDPPGTQKIDTIVSFGEDAAGRLYIVDYQGEVYRLVPEPSSLGLVAFAGAAALGRRRRE